MSNKRDRDELAFKDVYYETSDALRRSAETPHHTRADGAIEALAHFVAHTLPPETTAIAEQERVIKYVSDRLAFRIKTHLEKHIQGGCGSKSTVNVH